MPDKMGSKKSGFEMQEVFIKHLKEVAPANVSLVDDIADLLSISNDSAYRRLRCETELSLDETYRICKHYRISADNIFSNQAQSVTCNYIKLTDSADNFENYLSNLLKQLEQISKSENSSIIYAAEEVPIFHSFHSQKLSAFKLFYWQRSVLNIADYQNKKFDWDVIPEKQLLLAENIHKTYLQIPSNEIWTSDTIQTSVKQIEYYFESGAFKDKDDAITVLMELKEMVQTIHTYAEKENKNDRNNSYVVPFQLYNSDLVIGTNCIHVNSDGHIFSYISFNTLNSLTTSNQQFCGEIEHWMKNLSKKSTLISGIAEKQRFQFFNKIYKAIDVSIEKIKNY
ncbi:MAG TPA: hypothetical protein DIW31_04280 [Bacteroidales bacterium]|nr:hypothetical protein [Bacteroidales bacterium]